MFQKTYLEECPQTIQELTLWYSNALIIISDLKHQDLRERKIFKTSFRGH
jgi:hypothetical protein